MKWDFVKGDGVVIVGQVLHVRQDGTLDISIGRDKIAFAVNPEQCGLIADPGEEKDDFPD